MYRVQCQPQLISIEDPRTPRSDDGKLPIGACKSTFRPRWQDDGADSFPVVDHLSPEGRSRNMAAIRAKNTKPELALRAALREAGATGYRLHRKDIPGRPDIAFIRWKVAVFVDGVFWHGHPDHWNPEKASSDYWRSKIARNIQRDRAADKELAAMGWTNIRMWDQDVNSNVMRCARRVISALTERGWKA